MTNTKKRIIILLVAIVPVLAFGQRVLVKFSTGISSVPDGWPYELSNPVEHSDVLSGWSTNWTMEQVNERIASLKTQYDAIEAARFGAIETNRQAKIKLLSDLFTDFQTYENGWVAGTNYTAAQMQVILRKHNGALLLIKPILKELYDSRQ